MIIDDLTDAMILAEVRKRLSFIEAARHLKLPAATLSRRVAKMEERAGLKLFERTTRAVGTTPAGVIAAERAERMLGEAEALDLAVEELREAPAGVVRLSTPVIFGQAILGPVVARFLTAHPSCSLDVELSDRHVNLVEEAVDVVLRVGPTVDDALLVKPMGLVHAGLYGALGDDEVGPQVIDDLADWPVGLLHRGHAETPQLALTNAADECCIIPLTPRLICLNPWLLLEAALSGGLIVVLPDLVAAPHVAEGRLRRVLPDWLARRVPVHLAFTSRRLMRPAVRAFIDFSADTIPTLLGEQRSPLTRVHTPSAP